MRTSCLLTFGMLLATASVAPAITIPFGGNLNQDDDVVLFQYSVQNTGLVSVVTTSFAGGGFSPILTVFDELGEFLFEDVGYTNISGASDASLSWNSVAGSIYLVALTQYDNQSIAGTFGFGNISQGFVRDTQGNFTATSPFNPDTPGGSFLMPGLEQRTSAWSLEISSADPTLWVSPEPSTTALGALGAAVFYGISRARRRKNQLKQDE